MRGRDSESSPGRPWPAGSAREACPIREGRRIAEGIEAELIPTFKGVHSTLGRLRAFAAVRWCWTYVSLCLSLGCTSGTDRDPLVVRDSAGIVIVESSPFTSSLSSVWAVGRQPLVEIGSATGADLYRVADATRGPDGEIIVLNAGSHEVLVFDVQTSTLIRRFGRRGDGPGELQFPTSLYLAVPDTIVVADFGRINYFTLDGEFLKAPTITPAITLDRFDDGTFLAVQSLGRIASRELGHVEDSLAVVRVRASDADVDTIVRTIGEAAYRVRFGSAIRSYPAPFGTRPVVAITKNDLYIGNGVDFSIIAMSAEGRVSRIFRIESGERVLSRDAIRAFEDSIRANASQPSEVVHYNRLFSQWQYPSTYPAYDRFIVADDGRLWVRHYPLGVDSAESWSVFENDGRLAADVAIPGGLHVTSVGADYVLGVFRDSLGVESVRLYELSRR